jgi:Sec-independent protein secretion pathway component TatC
MTGNTPFKITQEIMLVFAILLEIPIVMIFLSRVLRYKANRWANIIAGVITIIFVIGGGSLTLHYIFFAAFEVAIMLLIIRYAWKWTNPEGSIEKKVH